ncbi:MAG: hypothetical protein U0930_24040 [Pirellulales bacterium]
MNFESKSSYTVRVRSTDQGGLFTEKALIINVTDTNEEPTDISLAPSTIAENAGTNATIGTLSTLDPDAPIPSPIRWLLERVIQTTLRLIYQARHSELQAAWNFESKSSYTVRVQSTDQGGLFTEKVLIINVTDTNEARLTYHLLLLRLLRTPVQIPL